MERQLRSLPLVERTVPELIRERASEAALVGAADGESGQPLN
jgi:DNA repair protein RecO (recombination protein O)